MSTVLQKQLLHLVGLIELPLPLLALQSTVSSICLVVTAQLDAFFVKGEAYLRNPSSHLLRLWLGDGFESFIGL